ncbi:MAG: TIGR03936 family radical SAM-associated protein, partial [Dethiosulfovibrio sp.]|nr:TIGR03936 family radical SAM-associated protein [Dethiosulfovibrio sp.]
MARVRILFSKRGPFCFIRHVDLPQIFSRSARRADLEIEQTEGFSPHPKISLGPALPVGVVACAEPGEIWFS